MASDHNNLSSHTISVSTATFVKAVLIGLGIWLLWFLRDIVAILFASLLLAALIDPFADWFHKRRVPRGIAVMIVYVILGIIACIVGFLLTPVVIEQSIQLLSNLGISQEILVGILQSFLDILQQGSVTFTAITSGAGIDSLRSVFSTVTDFLWWVGTVVVVLVLTFYMVVEEDSAKKYFRHLAPIEYQPYLVQLVNKMQKKIGAWLRGQLILGLLVGTAVYIGLTILGVEYALLLAVIAGLLEIVPYIGPIVSLVPAALIGFADSWIRGVFVVILYVIIQQLENNVLVPKVMQKVTGLNPIVSLVALLVGIKLGGFVGAVLSIPVATMAAVILEDLFAEPSPQHPPV